MKFSAKKLIFVVALLFLTVVSTKSIFGAATNTGGAWFVQPPSQYETIIKSAAETGQTSEEPYVLSVMTNIANGIILAIRGSTTTVQTASGPIQTYSGGAMGMMANLTSNLYTTAPASSIEYVADLGTNLGITKPAYAQGLGFSAFSPVLKLWKIFRDISYLGFVIIFVIVGFMVMFRRRIDPRTVVTIQEALPRIVVTLLLITFSYAIAGLMIDSSEFLTRLIGSTLNQNELIAVKGSSADQQGNLNALYASNIFELVNPLRNVDRLMEQLGGANIPLVSDLKNIPILGDLTIRLIFILAGIFIMFKIFFALIGPYVSIVLSIIFGPFILLLGAVPGSGGGVGSWLRDLASKVLVFPVTFAMLAIAAIIKGSATQPSALFPGGNANWGVAGNYTVGWAPATIGSWGNVVGDLVAFGILLTIPHVVEMVQSVFSVKAQPWQAAAGTELKGAAGRLPIIGGFISGAMG